LALSVARSSAWQSAASATNRDGKGGEVDAWACLRPVPRPAELVRT
jgi:hypothetical protein